MENSAKLVIDHYQKTYELTFKLWEARNRTLLILLAVVAGATLVMVPTLGTRSLLFIYVGHSLDLKPDALAELEKGFPYGILQAILLFVILYLMVNLYHRARYVLRNYAYLGALEGEIRQLLGAGENSVSFTRESTFYWGHRDFLSGAVKYVYIILLAGLLLAFLGTITATDWKRGSVLLTIVDLAFAVPTIIFLFGFATSSVSLDRKEAIVPAKRAAARKS
jgi:small-conductance mechanosensitive channel